MKVRRIERIPTGGMVWALPDCTLEVMWGGPGSGLLIGRPREAGGPVHRIEHPTCWGRFDTLRDAEAAVAAFVEAAA